ncbi:MAG: tetratricopeptide repeat protein [Planctomycetota bacterium]
MNHSPIFCGRLIMMSLLATTLCLGACETPRESTRQVVVELSGDPRIAQTAYELGLAKIGVGNLDAAEVHFRDAIDADVSHGPAHNNLGKIQYQNRQLRDAALSFQRAAENMPFRPEPANNLGLVFEAGNRLDAAVREYEKALSLDSENLVYVGNLARARVKRGDDDASLRRQLWQIADNDSREPWVEWARKQIDRLD